MCPLLSSSALLRDKQARGGLVRAGLDSQRPCGQRNTSRPWVAGCRHLSSGTGPKARSPGRPPIRMLLRGIKALPSLHVPFETSGSKPLIKKHETQKEPLTLLLICLKECRQKHLLGGKARHLSVTVHTECGRRGEIKQSLFAGLPLPPTVSGWPGRSVCSHVCSFSRRNCPLSP